MINSFLKKLIAVCLLVGERLKRLRLCQTLFFFRPPYDSRCNKFARSRARFGGDTDPEKPFIILLVASRIVAPSFFVELCNA